MVEQAPGRSNHTAFGEGYKQDAVAPMGAFEMLENLFSNLEGSMTEAQSSSIC